MRVLLAESNRTVLASASKSLGRYGFGVDYCTNLSELLSMMSSVSYDCVIMHIDHPGGEGFSAINTARSLGIRAPILLITPKNSVEDRIKGLNSGADDCLTNPFIFDELLARIRALMRRGGPVRRDVLTAADLEMDLQTREVERAGKKIKLTAKEFSILEYMLRNKNRLLTREQIIDHVWNYDFDSYSNIVDVYIRYLRKKLDTGYDKKLITTVRGSGYMLKDE